MKLINMCRILEGNLYGTATSKTDNRMGVIDKHHSKEIDLLMAGRPTVGVGFLTVQNSAHRTP
jgi:hypothetical protein